MIGKSETHLMLQINNVWREEKIKYPALLKGVSLKKKKVCSRWVIA